MMEKLGAPQTHLALKEMIIVVDQDKDGKINLHEVKIVVFSLLRTKGLLFRIN